MAQIIKLNIIPKGIPDVVNVSQFDVGRVIQFALYDGVNVYTIPSGATVTIAGRKGDNHVFVYEATIAEGRHAVSIETTEQMTAYAGENLCQLRITKTGIDIATVNFRMMVQERPDANGDISDSDLPMIIALATEQEQNAEAWAVGTKDGTPVGSGAPQYHNNSKYYKEQAATSATNAANSATAAAISETNAAASEAAAAGYVYGLPNALSIDVDGNPIEGNFAAGVADKLIVDIQPIQDLHGYDKPWVGGAGKNKLPMTLSGIKSANTSGTWSGNVYTINNGTFTVGTDNDGNVIWIKANGSFNARTTLRLVTSGDNYKPSPGSYIVSKGFTDTKLGVSVETYNNTTWGSRLAFSSNTDDVSFNVDYSGYDRLSSYLEITQATSVNNQIFYPMIRQATESDSTFAPYSNICPISGLTEMEVTDSGKNICGEFEQGAIANNTGNTYAQNKISSTIRIRSKSLIAVPNGETLTVSVNSSAFEYCLQAYDSNGLQLSATSKPFLNVWKSNSLQISGIPYVVIAVRKKTQADITPSDVTDLKLQLEVGSQATAYVPYVTPNTYTIDLDDTRYGGTLNVKTGVMTVNKICIDIGPLNWEIVSSNVVKANVATRAKFTAQNVKVNAICSSYYVSDQYHASNNKPCVSFNSAGQIYLWDNTHTFSTIEEAQQYLSGVLLCYEIETPVTVQLDPETVNLLKGYNYITANGNTVIHLSAVPEKLINYIVNAFGTDESGRTTASRAYAAKEYFYKDGFMYKVTTAIAQGAAFTVGTNCTKTTIFAELTALNS